MSRLASLAFLTLALGAVILAAALTDPRFASLLSR